MRIFEIILYFTIEIADFHGILTTQEGYSLLLYTGDPCQEFIADPQILNHSLEEPQILSLKIVEELL